MSEFGWEVRDGVGFVTLVGAERKNPLTFASYAALRDHFRALADDDAAHADEAEAAVAAMTPLGRLLEPDEVAFAVAFLAAPEAGAINGQTLVLDGGGIQG